MGIFFFVTFPVALIKHSSKNNLNKKGIKRETKRLLCLIVQGFSLLWWKSKGVKSLKQAATSRLQSDTENNVCMLAPSSFSPFIWCKILAREWCHSQWMGPLTRINVIKIIPIEICRGLFLRPFQILSSQQ